MYTCLTYFLIATPVYSFIMISSHNVYIEFSSDVRMFFGRLGERWGAPGSSFFSSGSRSLPSESMSPIVAWFA